MMNVHQSTMLRIATNATKKYQALPKMPWQDVFRNRPGTIGKGGIAGAFEQPARYLSEYAWRYYGGTEKTRALAWKAQHDIPPAIRMQIVKSFWFNKYYEKKKLPKKVKSSYSRTKLQESSQFRWRKSRSWQGRPSTSRWEGFDIKWPNKRNRCKCPNGKYNYKYSNSTKLFKSRCNCEIHKFKRPTVAWRSSKYRGFYSHRWF